MIFERSGSETPKEVSSCRTLIRCHYSLFAEPYLLLKILLQPREQPTFPLLSQLIDDMLRKDYCFDIALPRLPARKVLEETGQLEPRISILQDEFDAQALQVGDVEEGSLERMWGGLESQLGGSRLYITTGGEGGCGSGNKRVGCACAT